MGITFDRRKNARNIRERKVSFDDVAEFDWSGAVISEDTRKEYGERRYHALGFIGSRLHMLVFTPRGDDVHVISLRKANAREVKRYEETRQDQDF